MSNKLSGSNSKCFVQWATSTVLHWPWTWPLKQCSQQPSFDCISKNHVAATPTLHPVEQLPLCCINLQFNHSSNILSNHLYLINYAAATVIRPATWSRSRCPLEVMRLPLSMDQFTKSVFNILRYEYRTTTLLIKTQVFFSKHQLWKLISVGGQQQSPVTNPRLAICLPLGILLYNVKSLQLLETVSGNGTTALCKMRRSYTITLGSTINLTKSTHSNSLPQVYLPCHRCFQMATNPQNLKT